MTLTAADAEILLKDPVYQTSDGLLNLIRQLSIETPADSPGKITLLYSGKTAPSGDGIASTGAIASYIGDHYAANVRVIDSTEAAKFLTSRAFSTAIESIFPNRDVRDAWLYDAASGQ